MLKSFLWFLSFLFLCIAAVTGTFASIGAIDSGWFAVCLLSIALMFSCVEYVECYFKE